VPSFRSVSAAPKKGDADAQPAASRPDTSSHP
jgi:hypothetical protein